ELDMAPIKAAETANAIAKGFSIDANNQLHFKTGEFSRLAKTPYKNVVELQGGEALFGMFEDLRIDKTGNKLYFQLGCPYGTHLPGGLGHAMVQTGTGKAVPL